MDDSASKEGRYRAAWAAKKKTYQLDKNIDLVQPCELYFMGPYPCIFRNWICFSKMWFVQCVPVNMYS